jgi:hypothetical protein
MAEDEREMSTVLRNVFRELHNQDWREQVKSCANALLNACELSEQEAMYRLLSLPPFKCNFSTVFVPANLSFIVSMEDEDETFLRHRLY